ncbi:MAG: hypothetical protein AAF570_10805, partial [Bacteroidota bacterium]
WCQDNIAPYYDANFANLVYNQLRTAPTFQVAINGANRAVERVSRELRAQSNEQQVNSAEFGQFSDSNDLNMAIANDEIGNDDLINVDHGSGNDQGFDDDGNNQMELVSDFADDQQQDNLAPPPQNQPPQNQSPQSQAPQSQQPNDSANHPRDQYIHRPDNGSSLPQVPNQDASANHQAANPISDQQGDVDDSNEDGAMFDIEPDSSDEGDYADDDDSNVEHQDGDFDENDDFGEDDNDFLGQEEDDDGDKWGTLNYGQREINSAFHDQVNHNDIVAPESNVNDENSMAISDAGGDDSNALLNIIGGNSGGQQNDIGNPVDASPFSLNLLPDLGKFDADNDIAIVNPKEKADDDDPVHEEMKDELDVDSPRIDSDSNAMDTENEDDDDDGVDRTRLVGKEKLTKAHTNADALISFLKQSSFAKPFSQELLDAITNMVDLKGDLTLRRTNETKAKQIRNLQVIAQSHYDRFVGHGADEKAQKRAMFEKMRKNQKKKKKSKKGSKSSIKLWESKAHIYDESDLDTSDLSAPDNDLDSRYKKYPITMTPAAVRGHLPQIDESEETRGNAVGFNALETMMVVMKDGGLVPRMINGQLNINGKRRPMSEVEQSVQGHGDQRDQLFKELSQIQAGNYDKSSFDDQTDAGAAKAGQIKDTLNAMSPLLASAYFGNQAPYDAQGIEDTQEDQQGRNIALRDGMTREPQSAFGKLASAEKGNGLRGITGTDSDAEQRMLRSRTWQSLFYDLLQTVQKHTDSPESIVEDADFSSIQLHINRTTCLGCARQLSAELVRFWTLAARTFKVKSWREAQFILSPYLSFTIYTPALYQRSTEKKSSFANFDKIVMGLRDAGWEVVLSEGIKQGDRGNKNNTDSRTRTNGL